MENNPERRELKSRENGLLLAGDDNLIRLGDFKEFLCVNAVLFLASLLKKQLLYCLP
jgi:hypothetical protein